MRSSGQTTASTNQAARYMQSSEMCGSPNNRFNNSNLNTRPSTRQVHSTSMHATLKSDSFAPRPQTSGNVVRNKLRPRIAHEAAITAGKLMNSTIYSSSVTRVNLKSAGAQD